MSNNEIPLCYQRKIFQNSFWRSSIVQRKVIAKIVFKNQYNIDSCYRLLYDMVSPRLLGKADTPFESSIYTFTLDGNARCRIFRFFDRKQEVRFA
jgi:hypothetical protein